MLAKIRKLQFASPLFVGIAIIFSFITYAYFSGKIADFFLGEEYYVLGNSAVYPHWEAWWRYFLSNGRLFEGIYWTYLYEIIDFHPATIRLFSFGLHFLDALLAAIAISRVWPKKAGRKNVVFLILVLSFFNPYALNWVTRLSGDNARISIMFFWSATIMLQLWVSNKSRWAYLLGALSFQIFSIFTYENTIFLFPVAILLSTPLTAQELTSNNYRKTKQLAGLGFVSMFFVFIPYAVYYVLSKLPGIYLTHYVVSLTSSSLYERISGFFAVFGQSLIHLANTDVTDRGLAGWLYFFLVFAASGMIIFLRYYRNRSDGKLRHSYHGHEKLTYSMLFLSTVWLLVFGIVPYSFLGIASYRVYVTAMMGFPIVLLLLYQLSRGVWRILAVGAMLIWVLSAFVEFETKAFQIANSEEPYNYYYLSVYELVPDVKPDTWFVFVDFELGGWGCGPSLSMLYEKPDLLCARLSTRSPDYIADRYGGDILNVRNTGGWIRNGNMIIFGIDEKGKIYIMPEITPQSGVYVTWFSQEPIRTDFRRIVTDSSREMSPMAKHMYERRQILDTQ